IRLAFLAAISAALYLFVRRAQWRNWSGLAFLVLIWLDLLTHTAWQNPTVNPVVYQPGIGANAMALRPLPVPGEGRLLQSSQALVELDSKGLTNIEASFLVARAAFLHDCNYLDGVAKAEGFYSLYTKEIDMMLAA